MKKNRWQPTILAFAFWLPASTFASNDLYGPLRSYAQSPMQVSVIPTISALGLACLQST